jgi:tetratricopeptide (TPR) repeat protein
LLLAVTAAPVACSETICLRNGDRIEAVRVRNDGQRVHYEIGDNSYTIPSSLVDRVESTPEKTAPNPGRDDLVRSFTLLPAHPPAVPAGDAELFRRIVEGGRVDREALGAIESRDNPAQVAVAFYIAGRQEFQTGDYAQARRDFERALYYDRENPAILSFYAALLVKTGNGREAVSYAQRAVRLAPDSADALAVLGYAQFAADRLKDAAASWRSSLRLRPDQTVAQLLERAEREAAAESHYQERSSTHFVLRYEGGDGSDEFRRQILSTLEAAYRDLALAFQSEARASLEVVLYTREKFFDVTRAPTWIGALNDGKIRIPLRGLDSVTPDLARILKHELAHSFIHQLSMGRCPGWLNEGLAQALEPRSLGASGRALAALYGRGQEIPLNALEAGFSSLTGPEARLAYDESLATVEYLESQYGMSEVVRLLQKLGQGESLESALGSTVHLSYGKLEKETGAHLIERYGS